MSARVRTSPRSEPIVVEVALDEETRSYAFLVRKLNIAGGAATLPEALSLAVEAVDFALEDASAKSDDAHQATPRGYRKAELSLSIA